MAENGKSTSPPDLARDDFEWEVSDTASSSSSSSQPPRTTELDRIEFEDPGAGVVQQNAGEEVPPAEPPAEEEAAPARKSPLLLLRIPKMALLATLAVVFIAVVGGSIYFFTRGDSGETGKAGGTRTPGGLPVSRDEVLADFILPAQGGHSFVSYSVRVTVNGVLFDFFLSEENGVRAEIYGVLRELDGTIKEIEFSRLVTEKVNNRLKRSVLFAAEVASSEII